MSVTLSRPSNAVDAYMMVLTMSGAWRSQTVHMIRTAEQHSHPMKPHSLLLERLPLSADRRD